MARQRCPLSGRPYDGERSDDQERLPAQSIREGTPLLEGPYSYAPASPLVRRPTCDRQLSRVKSELASERQQSQVACPSNCRYASILDATSGAGQCACCSPLFLVVA